MMKELHYRHELLVVISDKDILKQLLNIDGIHYMVIAQASPKENLWQKFIKLFRSTFLLLKIAKHFKPDLVISCLSQLIWVAWLLRKKSIFTAEDDIHYTRMQGLITYPFVSTILTPAVVNVKPFSRKRVGYSGYHKLAYLHPSVFKPESAIRKKYNLEDKYFVIRTVNQKAYHDIHAKGLDAVILREIIFLLKAKGSVYITSEKPLPVELEPYRLKIDPMDIHHVMYFAELFIADSQSMSVEAAILGTPSIRFNNFAGKISVINELEFKYELTYSIDTSQKEKLLPLIEKIVSSQNSDYSAKRMKMLADKIDVSSFFIWFIENYPSSAAIMRENPDYQNNFR